MVEWKKKIKYQFYVRNLNSFYLRSGVLEQDVNSSLSG